MSKIVVLGGGESGVGAAVLAKVKGYEVFLSDSGKIAPEHRTTLQKWEIPFEEGGHSIARLLDAEEAVKSPGIPESAPAVQTLRAHGVGIISEIEFASRYDSAKKICVTGSNGKTTTTSLIYKMMKDAGLNAGLGGNIGNSYAYQVATEQHDYYVLEISSFQLDDCYSFRPDIAIITNITPDHLDRYDYKLENYVAAKFRIVRNMQRSDCFIFDSDDQITTEHLDRIVVRAKSLPFSQKERPHGDGAFLEDGKIVTLFEGERDEYPTDRIGIIGKHNIYNSMAAALAAKAAGITSGSIRESLRTFKPLEHRLEPILEIGDVLYVNDSKATNVDAAWYALDSQTRPVVWIAGGTDKGNDYSVLLPLVKEKVHALVCLGKDNRKLHEAFEGILGKENIADALSAQEAAQLARNFARKGDVVLLSPCCASFDLFTCYEDRGEKFKQAVREL